MVYMDGDRQGEQSGDGCCGCDSDGQCNGNGNDHEPNMSSHEDGYDRSSSDSSSSSCAATAAAATFLRFAALTTLVAAGPAMVFSMSVLVVPFEQTFNVTRTESSATISFAWTAQFLIGLPTAWCFKRISAPKIVLLGTFIAACGGLLAAGATTTMLEVHVFLGGLTGIGQGILWCLTCFMIPIYFPNQIGFANGIVYGFGNGFGTLIWSFGFEWLTQEYSWRRAVMLATIGSTVALFLPLAVLVSKLTPSYIKSPDERRKTISADRGEERERDQAGMAEAAVASGGSSLMISLSSKKCCTPRASALMGSNGNLNYASTVKEPHYDDNSNNGEERGDYDHHPAASLTFGEFMLTRNVILIGMSYFSFCMATLGAFGHISTQVQSLGMSSDTGAIVVSVAGFTGMSSRPIGGFLADRYFGNRPLLVGAAFFTSVLFLVWNVCSTPASAIFFGGAFGCMFSLYYTVLAGLLWETGGQKHFNELFSALNGLFGLPGCLFSSSIFGMTFSIQRNYWISGFIGSVLMLLAAAFPLFMNLERRKCLNVVQQGVKYHRNRATSGEDIEVIMIL